MDDKTKNSIISTAVSRAEVRMSLELWQYLPVIDSLYSSFTSNEIKRHTMLMFILEDIAFEAWRNGQRRAQEDAYEESQK